MILDDFKKHSDWVKVWSGRWSLHSDSNFGEHWTVKDKVAGKPAYSRVIYVYRKGITDCWVRERDKDDLGKRLVRKVGSTKAAKALAAALKKEAESIFSFIKSHRPKDLGPKEYRLFWNLVGRYYLPHLSVKYIVDYFSESQLERFLPILEDARLYSEPVFRDTENFMENLAKEIAARSGYRKEQILGTLKEELLEYFKMGILPGKKQLSARYERSILLVDCGQQQLCVGKDAAQVEKMLLEKARPGLLKGSIAYPGRAVGLARLVIDPRRNGSSFQKGEILVTGMTRPEFLPIMKKAAAFITDAGGILSHAAIVARELKKPCIIGTHIATRVLRDGDKVEVDADKGLVRRIK